MKIISANQTFFFFFLLQFARFSFYYPSQNMLYQTYPKINHPNYMISYKVKHYYVKIITFSSVTPPYFHELLLLPPPLPRLPTHARKKCLLSRSLSERRSFSPPRRRWLLWTCARAIRVRYRRDSIYTNVFAMRYLAHARAKKIASFLETQLFFFPFRGAYAEGLTESRKLCDNIPC